MSDDIEALGGLATGALIAGAIDRERGAKGEAHGACLNCETPLHGRFCDNCGQPAHVHRTLGHVFEEFLHGVLHFDTKAWRTIPLLLFKPGKLTRDYVHGKRARYIAPFALFLFTVFVMFFTFGFMGQPEFDDSAFRVQTKAEEIAAAKKDVAEKEQELVQAERMLASAQRDRTSKPGAIGELSGEVAGAKAALSAAQAELKVEEAQPEDDRTAVPGVRPSNGTWQDNIRYSVESGQMNVNIGSKTLNERGRKALLNPDLTLYKMQQKAYKLSFLLVPLSLPFLWLLFPFRRSVTLYDHTVFALYSLSFMSLLFVALALTWRWGGSSGMQIAATAFGIIPPIHMYLQLKGAYALGWLSALWRTFWLLIFSQIVVAIFFALIIVLGIVD
ncbi:DUF3667 domain-containing protein [Sphingoaurantiacus capsulatus]|uniref:DUF3667 domain-containing protein n=1 Tax=Sphingoaurantiacus capsulatus TaxID=1771310 RepID=A0ABV7X6K4_9SPHN